jgi:serine/threonine protein kinase
MDPTSPFTSSSATPEGEFSDILAGYLEAIDRGDRPDRAALLEQYPRWADRLRDFFADQDRLEKLTGPLREEDPGEAAGLTYEFLEEISRGGMGVILRCRDRALHRDLAIKVLLDQYRDQPDLVRRFIEEARITGQLQHPFIVPVHKLGTLEDGRPYFAMKLVEGRTFADLLQERPTPAHDLPRYLQIFEQVCQTVAYAHSKGVIHRDLKPANVMVGQFGEVQVMDWGLAKILDAAPPEGPAAAPPAANAEEQPEEPMPSQTQAGSVLGTFAYMPPEQARGDLDRVNRRSDVFGLGAILCETLTGLPPYAGDPAKVQARARSGGIDQALARLDECGAEASLTSLAKECLAIDPAERPGDGSGVADAMRRYFAAVQERVRLAEITRARAETQALEEHKRLVLAEAKAEAEQKRGKAERRRRRASVLLGASLSLLLILGASFGLWYQKEQWTRATETITRRNATERDITTALAEVRLRREEGIKQSEYPERWKEILTGARDAWQRAANALKLGEPTDELRALVDQAQAELEQDERDRQFFLTLERRWLEVGSLSWEDARRPRDASFLTRVFKDYGLDFEAADPKDFAARIQRHPHRARLLEAIDNVGYYQASVNSKPQQRTGQFGRRGLQVSKTDWSKAEKIERILDEIDSDPQSFQKKWRAARRQHQTATLIQMAQSLDARQLSVRAVVSLAHDLMQMEAYNQAYQVLANVDERHPSDYFLNQTLGMLCLARSLTEDKGTFEEAIGYFHAALAVRGNNPASHLVLSQIYKSQGKNDQAIRSARAAVERTGNRRRPITTWGPSIMP